MVKSRIGIPIVASFDRYVAVQQMTKPSQTFPEFRKIQTQIGHPAYLFDAMHPAAALSIRLGGDKLGPKATNGRKLSGTAWG
jgi:hypothetical protein